MRQIFSASILVFISFFIAYSSMGVIPIFSQVLKSHHSPWGFAPYFFCLLMGQLYLYWDKQLHTKIFLLKYIVGIYILTLIMLNLLLQHQQEAYAFYTLLLVRCIEGIAVGIGLPLFFQSIMQSYLSSNNDIKLLVFNISSLLGYVFGIASFENWPFPKLGFIPACTIVLSLLLVFYWIKPPAQQTLTSADNITQALQQQIQRQQRWSYWLETFFLIFLCKMFHSFFISHLIFEPVLYRHGLLVIIAIVCGLNILAQIVFAWLSRRFELCRLILITTLIFFASLLFFQWKQLLWSYLPLVILQAGIFFLGLKKVAFKPNNAKNFALINGLSDPGLVLGSGLAIFGTRGGISIIALLALVPSLTHWLLHRKNK